jgi:hypothetical protein
VPHYIRKFPTEELLMAREPEKLVQETNRAKTGATAASKNNGNEESAAEKSTPEMLKEQHRQLHAILAKHS